MFVKCNYMRSEDDREGMKWRSCWLIYSFCERKILQARQSFEAFSLFQGLVQGKGKLFVFIFCHTSKVKCEKVVDTSTVHIV